VAVNVTAALIPMTIFLLTFVGAVYVASISLGKGAVLASVALVAMMWVFWLTPNAADIMVGITLAMIVLIVALKVALVIEQRRTRNTKEA
jgi:hypothetical protein